MPSLELVLNVALGGILTGLVYGLMALGLSVIFGVVRVVNFAHGEMMTIAMYLAVTLFAAFGLDPLDHAGADRGRAVRARLRAAGGLINPFITRPEHSQFMLLVAIGHHHRQRPADHLRARRAERADVLFASTASRSGR